MDGRRLLAQPMTWVARWRAPSPTSARRRPRVRRDPAMPPSRMGRLGRRLWVTLLRIRLPRGVGLAATALVMIAGLGYGVIKGDHVPTILATLTDARDQAA